VVIVVQGAMAARHGAQGGDAHSDERRT
jgi:hypothetical protein